MEDHVSLLEKGLQSGTACIEERILQTVADSAIGEPQNYMFAEMSLLLRNLPLKKSTLADSSTLR